MYTPPTSSFLLSLRTEEANLVWKFFWGLSLLVPMPSLLIRGLLSLRAKWSYISLSKGQFFPQLSVSLAPISREPFFALDFGSTLCKNVEMLFYANLSTDGKFLSVSPAFSFQKSEPQNVDEIRRGFLKAFSRRKFPPYLADGTNLKSPSTYLVSCLLGREREALEPTSDTKPRLNLPACCL